MSSFFTVQGGTTMLSPGFGQASARHVSGSDSCVPRGPSDNFFGMIDGNVDLNSPSASYDSFGAACVGIKTEENESCDWPNMDFLDEPDTWNLPMTNGDFDSMDSKFGIVLNDAVCQQQQPVQANSPSSGNVFQMQQQDPSNTMIHDEFFENPSIDIADVLKEHEEALKAATSPLIPTPVLEMGRASAGDTTVVAVAHNCGASVNVNDTHHLEEGSDQHFLLRKFLNDESYLASVRHSETMSAYEHISNVLLNATSSPAPSTTRQSETILVDVKKEDYTDYCQLGGNDSPYGTGSSMSNGGMEDDHYYAVSPAGSPSSLASSGLGKSPAYSYAPESSGPQHHQQEEDSLEPLVSIVMRQFKNEITRTCMQLHISSDPSMWSVEDVHKWIKMAVEHYNMPAVNLSKFMIDGSTFTSLSETEFKTRAPESGEELYATLYLWKTAQQAQEHPATATAMSPAASYASPGSAGVPSPMNHGGYPAVGTPSSESGESTPNPPSTDASTSSMDCGDSDDEEAETESTIEKPAPTATTRTGNAHIQLWQFLKELLADSQHYGACIRWLDRSNGVFKIEDSVRVARLWGRRKNRPAMNYDKLSRSIRQYYKKGIMKKTERSQRLVYQFCSPYYL